MPSSRNDRSNDVEQATIGEDGAWQPEAIRQAATGKPATPHAPLAGLADAAGRLRRPLAGSVGGRRAGRLEPGLPVVYARRGVAAGALLALGGALGAILAGPTGTTRSQALNHRSTAAQTSQPVPRGRPGDTARPRSPGSVSRRRAPRRPHHTPRYRRPTATGRRRAARHQPTTPMRAVSPAQPHVAAVPPRPGRSSPPTIAPASATAPRRPAHPSSQGHGAPEFGSTGEFSP
jgi:hypothetical protein